MHIRCLNTPTISNTSGRAPGGELFGCLVRQCTCTPSPKYMYINIHVCLCACTSMYMYATVHIRRCASCCLDVHSHVHVLHVHIHGVHVQGIPVHWLTFMWHTCRPSHVQLCIPWVTNSTSQAAKVSADGRSAKTPKLVLSVSATNSTGFRVWEVFLKAEVGFQLSEYSDNHSNK